MRNVSTGKLNVSYYSLHVTGSSWQISLTTKKKKVPSSHGKEKGEGEGCLRRLFLKPIVKSIFKVCLHYSWGEFDDCKTQKQP